MYTFEDKDFRAGLKRLLCDRLKTITNERNFGCEFARNFG